MNFTCSMNLDTYISLSIYLYVLACVCMFMNISTLYSKHYVDIIFMNSRSKRIKIFLCIFFF